MTSRLAAFAMLVPIVLSPPTHAPGPTAREAAIARPGSTPSSSSWRRPTVGGPSFSPDGSKVLFTSDASGIFNAYTVPFAGGPIDAA